MGNAQSKPHLDVAALHAALDGQRRSRSMSWRSVAAEAGVSASTLTRMADGKRPDVDSFASLVKWLGVSADEFLRGEDAGTAEPSSLAVLSTHLRAGRDMSPETVAALHDLLGAVDRLMRRPHEHDDEQ